MTLRSTEIRLHYYRWMVLLAALLSFMMYAFSLQSVPPLIQQLKIMYGIDNAIAGLLMSVLVIPAIILALPAGVLIDRYGYRKVGLLSILTIALGSLMMAFSQDITSALFSRFIVGIGGGLVTVGTPSIVPQWFEHKEMGKAMGVYAVGMPVATTVAFFSVPILAQIFGWQAPFYLSFIMSMITVVVFWLIVHDGPLKNRGTTVKLSEVKEVFGNSEVFKVSLVWMFFNMVSIGFLTWAPAMFVMFKGLSIIYASMVASLIMIANFFFVPVYGWASDKLGRRKPFIIVGPIAMALSLYFIAYAMGIILPLSVFVLGASAGTIPPIVMAITGQTLPPKQAGMGFGVVSFWQNLGSALTAPVIGYLIQVTDSLPLTFAGMSLFAFLAAAVALTATTK
ncbi:MAG TPA: MFS transporter [Candidatus Sulfotelmatobacter sp.]|nr:MFS transporter [Candidatus Sulfotelmatobacter sp.]